MISKELLNEVLNIKLRSFDINPNKTLISYITDKQSLSNFKSINIYELAHKCKVWAYNRKYLLDISENKIKISIQKDLPYYLTTIQNVNQGNNFIPFDPYIDIKACQWIYDNKESK